MYLIFAMVYILIIRFKNIQIIFETIHTLVLNHTEEMGEKARIIPMSISRPAYLPDNWDNDMEMSGLMSYLKVCSKAYFH
jgi:hypothetical protein